MSHDSKKLIQAALVAAIAAGTLATSACAADNKAAAKNEMQKCYGVVKAGMNDCGTSTHACASQSTKDGDPNEWLYLPKGTCDKLVNGKTK